MKKGEFYRKQTNSQGVYCYNGKVEHMDTGEELAVLMSFKDKRTYVINKEWFEALVNAGDYVKVEL
ncbi:hypothetical protein ACW2QC_07595 [Virgibacillus sp. FSP13]